MQVPRSHAMEEARKEGRKQEERSIRKKKQGLGMKLIVVTSPLRQGAESFAELGSLSWLNALISWLWPSFNRAVMDFVHEDLMPRLRDALPSMLRVPQGSADPDQFEEYQEMAHGSDQMSKIESVLRFFFFLFFDGDSFFGNMIIHVDDFYGLGEGM
ncbi:hypothetical protein AK812_SmicGene25408 [Symbiodinium microadriaticum]|uniref:Uncharacterized protein n=1 Tax=Symbiodinium microadriaticum TaxID=2951 RepID=A0A1Q9DBW3_SYMMI|nr:hypothetical protein AK812_SmicGene25408 [Symbiodinium microadriaticum]